MAGRPDGGSTPATSDSSVQVRHDGHVVAAADITTSEAHGTAKVSFSTPHAEVPPDSRTELVDQVLEHPEVQSSDAVHVVVPLGDSEALTRLQERTNNFNARAAGASSIVEAEVPRPDGED